MKKVFIILFISLSFSVHIKAQLFSSNQDAYNWGARLGLEARGKVELVNKHYEKAYNTFREAYNNYNSNVAALFLGYMYEFGMYVNANQSKARQYYEWSAQKNNNTARSELNRINKNGFMSPTEETRNNVISQIKMIYGIYDRAPIPNYGGGGSYGSGSSGSSSQICRSCSGTGRCSGCSGRGKYWEEVGQFTGYYHQKEINCPICNGTGRCRTCYGKGTL